MAPGRALLPAIGLFAVAALAPRPARAAERSAGEAPAEACDLFAFRGSAPKPDEREVPLDARILVAYRACGSARASITLWQHGLPVDGTPVYGWSADASWATFKPARPLDAHSPYVVVLDTDKGSSHVRFATGASLSPPDAEARPSLRVLDARFASPRLMPDGRARADFTLELIHPKAGPLGVFYVGGPKPVANSTALVTERLALADGRPTVPVLQTIEARAGEPSCFSVLYEDAAGRLSTSSEPACAVVPGEPPAAEGEGTASAGCAVGARAAASASASSLLVVAAALGFARRARRRR